MLGSPWQELCKAWLLAEPVGVERVSRGAMGAVYRLDTPAGPVAVKELFAWNDLPEPVLEVTRTAAARASGVRCPLELVATDGTFVVSVAGTRFRGYEWVDGVIPTPTESTAHEAGAILGVLHQIAPATDEPEDPFASVPPTPEAWASLLERGRGQDWQPHVRRLLPDLLSRTEDALAAPAGDRVLSHRDLDPDNTLATPDGIVVLDWEDVGPIAPDAEIAGTLPGWTAPDARVDVRAVRAFRDAYAQHSPPPALSPSSFARTTISRLNYLHGWAEAFVTDDVSPDDLAFARRAVERSLAASWDGALELAIIAAWDS